MTTGFLALPRTSLQRVAALAAVSYAVREGAKFGSQNGQSLSKLIDARIRELGDWRGEMLVRLRALVKEADPEVVEEWKFL